MLKRSKRRDLEQPVSNEWKLDWIVAETPSSILYRLAGGRGAGCVSVTRIDVAEPYVERFLSSVEAQSDLGAPIETFGIDEDGKGYIHWGFESAKQLLFDSPDGAVIRARFLKVLLAIEALQEKIDFHGALTLASFIVDENQDVRLFDLCRVEELQKESDVSGMLARYFMPDGEGVHTASVRDVYALAIIGLELYGASFTDTVLDDNALDEGLRTLSQETPRWVESVLVPIVRDFKNPKYHTVSALISAIAIDERTYTGNGDEKSDVSLEELASLMRRGGKKKTRFDVHTFVTSRKGIAFSLTFLVVMLSCLGLLRIDTGFLATSFSASTSSRPDSPKVNATAPPPDFSEARVFLMLDDKEVLGNSNKLERAWDSLVENRRSAGDTSDVLEHLTRHIKSVGFDETDHAAFLMRLLDPSISNSDKADNLERYVAGNEIDMEELVVSLAHQAETELEVYRGVLEAELKNRGVSIEGKELSTEAILLLINTRGTLSSGVVAQYVSALSLRDVWHVLSYHATKRSKSLRDIVQAVLVRDDIGIYQRFYLEPLGQSSLDGTLPTRALLHGITEGVTENDIEQFLQWHGEGSEELLLASLNAASPKMAFLAFSGLASRPIEDSFLRAMIQLAEQVDLRQEPEFAPLLILAGLGGKLPEVEQQQLIRRAADVLTTDSQIITAMFASHREALVQRVLSELGESLHPSILVVMLDADSSDIRRNALLLLQNVRVQSIRQAVLKKYFDEKDESVRALYADLGLLQ